MKGALFTRTGDFVADFELPDFSIMPEVAVYGTRIFILKAPFEQTVQRPAVPEYFEAVGWSVDVSKALTALKVAQHSGKTITDYGEGDSRSSETPWADKLKDTISGNPPADGRWDACAPQPVDPKTGQYGDYFILPACERKKEFLRPLRDAYRHEKCGEVTKMQKQIAETYARDPKYYGRTFCMVCRDHFPVDEFTWWPDGSVVGS